jgi:hypothetical protein
LSAALYLSASVWDSAETEDILPEYGGLPIGYEDDLHVGATLPAEYRKRLGKLAQRGANPEFEQIGADAVKLFSRRRDAFVLAILGSHVRTSRAPALTRIHLYERPSKGLRGGR